MADLPNALVKISGFYGTSDPPHAYPHHGGARAVRSIIDAFGSARCLWGSDFAPALDFVSFPQAMHWPGIDDLSGPARDAIMRGNLARLLQKTNAAIRRHEPPKGSIGGIADTGLAMTTSALAEEGANPIVAAAALFRRI